MRILIYLMTIPLAVSLNAQSKLVLDLNFIPHQKYEYRYPRHNEVQPLLVYQIKLNDELLFVEVQSMETKEGLDSQPTKFLDLYQKEDFDQLKNLGKGAQKILVVNETQDQFHISSLSSLKKLNGGSLVYQNWKYKFQWNQSNKSNPSNLQPGGSPLEFIESIFIECAEVFVFRQYYSSQKDLFTEIYFHPTIGVLKESNINNFGSTVLELFSINDQPLALYLKNNCSTEEEPSLTFQEKGSRGRKKEFHIVQKGETLYQIAKKYNISTSEIMEINHLKNSQIKIGDIIYLANEIENKTKSDKPLIETHPEMFDDVHKAPKGRVGQSNGNALITRGLPKQYASSSSNSLDTKNRIIHFVLSGETLYAIARKYRTTVDKIIELNHLDKENPKIQPDQKLYIN